ncbi:hypothetical protein [Streptacidiphilus carbonis]|uniref:hypothetical protein n=1 Tax=Streptacidiphilus carbonis TaxID=105422 RepID=UPI0006948427|nr:hypothetical protein [Streptacidiphilus carbonis]
MAAILLTALALGGAAACSSGSGSAQAGSAAPTPAASTPVTASGSGSAPAPAATTASPAPTGTGPAPTTPSAPASSATATPGGSCLSGAVRVLYPGADNPLRTVCVHVGAQITVTLNAVASYKWAPVTSSVPAVVLMLGSHAADGGTLVEVARAQAPGAAVLTSADTFTPDPHGPPARMWQLKVTVVP